MKLTFMIISIAFGLILLGTVISYFALWGKGGEYYENNGKYKHVQKEQSFKHVMNHPAFKGFGTYMLPWERGWIPMATKPLKMSFLLPKLGAWEPDTIISGMNDLIDRINDGHQVFYPFYSEQEIAKEPGKKTTGLLFYEGKKDAPFALVIAGGGFSSVALIQEAFPVAQRLNEKGYNVFVLKYRVGNWEKDDEYADKVRRAGQDLTAALHYIFDHAQQFAVSTENYSVWGFSAGGRMTGNFGSPEEPGLGYEQTGLPAPSTEVMVYPGMPYSFSTNPPTYIVVAEDDDIVPVPALDQRVASMKQAGIDIQYVKFPTGGHGFGAGVGTDADGWMNAAIDFWKAHQK